MQLKLTNIVENLKEFRKAKIDNFKVEIMNVLDNLKMKKFCRIDSVPSRFLKKFNKMP